MYLKHSPRVIRTTIQRLEKKGCIRRIEFKNGRGGWTRYELPESIYHEVLRSETSNKPATNPQQSGNRTGNKPL
jgi:DNA-binding transcriptional regulator PaaX